MRNALVLIAFSVLFAFSIEAQETRPHCFTDEVTGELMRKNPQLRIERDAIDQFTADWINNHKNEGRSVTGASQIYIIPVVFHVLHDYGTENVSDDLIRNAVALMNLDFRHQKADTVDIIPAFKQIAADCEIEFRLATIDPNGDCTSGIEHIWTLKTYEADDDSKVDPNWMVWPRSQYLNIWLSHDLALSGAAAYAQFPSNWNASTDGVLCWYTYANNTANTLTHEAGHCLNLYHVWGGTNQPRVSCGDDQVFDTPVTQGWTFCPSETMAKDCDPNIIENFQNYMDYSYCYRMFTAGQKQRMVLCLNNSTGDRNNLWTNSNLIATGTDQIYPVTCSPIADFKAESNAACVNSPVTFYDQSWKGITTNWSWEFPGGNPSVSNDTNPTVSYSTPGNYTAKLIASNQYGSDSIVKTNIIHISGNPQTTLPWSEDFEGTSPFPGIDGWIHNNDGGSINWVLNNVASKDSGTHSIRINNYTNTYRNKEEWVTPSFSFTGITFPIKLSFDVAYAQRYASAEDELRVYYSTDCGVNWFPTSYFKSGALLATNGGAYVAGSFTPNQNQWRREIIAVNAVQNMANVRFKFENVTKEGNNIYIDNINLTGNFTGIDEEDYLASSITVYPNPSQGVSNVDFNIIKGTVVSVEIKDVTGQSVAKVVQNKKYDAGLHQVTLPSLAPGIYMITVTVNSKPHVVRLIVS